MVTGSKGMMGAAVLTTKAALRVGSGLVSAYIPRDGYDIMQETVPEAMALTGGDEALSGLPELSKFDCIGIGPGIGMSSGTRETVALLLDHWQKPLVIDADALNIIAAERWLGRVPPHSILTPHPGEFKRLAGESHNDFDMLEMQRQLSTKYHITIVLKRAFTCITLPDGSAHFNSSGSPALATGGSGDVLTGMVTGLLAQGYAPKDAARLGVWLHGTAGELAAEDSSDEAVIAGDIVEYIGPAYRMLSA
jgi:NAD(P)H-hydrate epimerase